jgi:hypothetical protein
MLSVWWRWVQVSWYHFACSFTHLRLHKHLHTCDERYTSEQVHGEVYNGEKCEKHNTKVRDILYIIAKQTLRVV